MPNKLFSLFSALLLSVFILAHPAHAETARDLTAQCAFSASKGSAKSFASLYNHSYTHFWQAGKSHYNYLEVRLPAGETCSGVQIKWAAINPNWTIEILKDGKWTPIGECSHEYLTTYTPLPGVSEFRIAAHNRVADYLRINEITVLSPGELPPDIQVWEPTHEKADLLLLVAHPDDEFIFMGGLVPWYGAERRKKVVVAYLTESTAERRTELLDGLWEAGLRNYPVTGKFHDRYSTSMETCYKRDGKARIRNYTIELVRRFKPEVIVTHDIRGEYGHGMHKVCADAVINAVNSAGDASKHKDSADKYGTWEVPKCYIHLYEKDPVRFNWKTPLSAFGGRTAYDIACSGFKRHQSQQKTEYEVYIDGPYDSQVFGLYRSTVGPDVSHDDLFENLDTVPASDNS